jgi:general stress protein 26
MKRAVQHTAGMQKIADLIGGIAVGMLTWADETGRLSSRPMMTLEMDADGSLWYFTRRTEGKADAQGKVNVAFARPDDASYVSVSGRATLVEDAGKVKELWHPAAQPWFPDGPEDSSLALLRVDVDDAEYWDASSSTMVRLTAQAMAGPNVDAPGLGDTGKVLNPQFPSAVV